MQMLSVMKHDVEPVLLDIADWIDETFARAAEDREMRLNPDDRSATLPRSFSLVKASTYAQTSPAKPLGSADLGAPLAADDDEEDDVLSFSTKRTRQTSNDSSTSLTGAARAQQQLHRFHSNTNSGLSGDSLDLPITPPAFLDDSRFDTIKPSRQAKGSYAFFTQKKAEAPRIAMTPQVRTRTGSPANLDHAKGGLSEAELLRRRRVEAVYGMIDEPSHQYDQHERGNDDDDDEEEQRGFRW
jgi:hypothetical protein